MTTDNEGDYDGDDDEDYCGPEAEAIRITMKTMMTITADRRPKPNGWMNNNDEAELPKTYFRETYITYIHEKIPPRLRRGCRAPCHSPGDRGMTPAIPKWCPPNTMVLQTPPCNQ